ncbi:MAG: hypothetical protein ACLR0P_00785 [Oscillospiraceae bacterium]
MAQLLMPGSVVAMTDQAADRLLKLDSARRCPAVPAPAALGHAGRPALAGGPEAAGAGPAEGARPGPGRSVRRSGRPGRPRGGPAPGVWGGGYHRRPQRPGLHLPGPGR